MRTLLVVAAVLSLGAAPAAACDPPAAQLRALQGRAYSIAPQAADCPPVEYVDPVPVQTRRVVVQEAPVVLYRQAQVRNVYVREAPVREVRVREVVQVREVAQDYCPPSQLGVRSAGHGGQANVNVNVTSSAGRGGLFRGLGSRGNANASRTSVKVVTR